MLLEHEEPSSIDMTFRSDRISRGNDHWSVEHRRYVLIAHAFEIGHQVESTLNCAIHGAKFGLLQDTTLRCAATIEKDGRKGKAQFCQCRLEDLSYQMLRSGLGIQISRAREAQVRWRESSAQDGDMGQQVQHEAALPALQLQRLPSNHAELRTRNDLAPVSHNEIMFGVKRLLETAQVVLLIGGLDVRQHCLEAQPVSPYRQLGLFPAK